MLNTIKRIIKHNFFAKLLSLVFAVVLWLFLMENENPTIEREWTLPIEVANASGEFDYTYSPKNVKVTISGKRMYFATLDPERMRATIDLEGIENSETFEVPILTEIPKGYEGIEKSDEKVRVHIDPYVTVPIMVDIKMRGGIEDIERVKQIQNTSTMLQIKGTARNTAKVNKLVGYVDIIGKEKDFEADVVLIPVDNAGREVTGVKLITETAKVHVKMKKAVISKNVAVEATINGNERPKEVSVTPQYIEITGDEAILENINTIPTLPVLNENGSVKVGLVLPKGVSAKVTTVNVNIKR